MKPQYKIPMNWKRGTMFTAAIDWPKFHRHCKKHGIQLKTANQRSTKI